MAGRTSSTPTLRQQRAALVRELMDQGHAVDEAARRAGIGRSYAREVLADPDGVRVRARRAGYGRCRDCGGPVDGSGGRSGAPQRCRLCSRAMQRAESVWPPERVIAVLKAWVAEHGRAPVVAELGPATGLPSYRTLRTRFGTAAAAFAAAGIERRGPGRNAQRYPEAAREVSHETGKRGAAIRWARQRAVDAKAGRPAADA